MFAVAQVQPTAYVPCNRSYTEHRGDDAMMKKEIDVAKLSSDKLEMLKAEYSGTEIRVEVKPGKVTGLNVVSVYPVLSKEEDEAIRNEATERMFALSERKRKLKVRSGL